MSSLTANLITADLNQFKNTVKYNSGQYATVTHYKRAYPHQAQPHPQRIRVPLAPAGPPKPRPGVEHRALVRAGGVAGRERAKFYSRPVLPGNQGAVPVIKYAPDVSQVLRVVLQSWITSLVVQVQDDFTAEFLSRRDSGETVRRTAARVANVSVQVSTINFSQLPYSKISALDFVSRDGDPD